MDEQGRALVRHSPTSAMLTFENRMSLAQLLVTTNFLPPSIKTAAQAVAVIQTGHELGIPPMQSLRSIAVIQNKPTLSSELMMALFKMRGGRSKWEESTDTKAVLWLRHPNGDEHVETYTWEDAVKAKLTGKDNWKSYPRLMLRARCTATGIRAIAPDILAGIYSHDELGVEESPEGELIVLPDRVVNADKYAQMEYLDTLLSIPVFSQKDRDSYRARAEAGESMAVLINDALAAGKKKGAGELQEKVAGDATVSSVVTSEVNS